MGAAPDTRWFRDPTRGGIASALNELARATGLGVRLDEANIAVSPMVGGACELLGIDPFHVANEGRLLAVVSAESQVQALAACRSTSGGEQGAIIGSIVADPPRLVVARTRYGGERIVDQLVGDPLPRIC